MNFLMGGMILTGMIVRRRMAAAAAPTTASFWFVMSMGLLVGFITAYPMIWWLVTYHLKHGMMTVRPAGAAACARGYSPPSPSSRATRARPVSLAPLPGSVQVAVPVLHAALGAAP